MRGSNNNLDCLEAFQRAQIEDVDHIVPIDNPNVKAQGEEEFVTAWW